MRYRPALQICSLFLASAPTVSLAQVGEAVILAPGLVDEVRVMADFHLPTFTFECWLKVSDLTCPGASAFGSLAYYGTSSGAAAWGINVGAPCGQPEKASMSFFINYLLPNTTSFGSSVDLGLDWRHVAVTYDGSEARFYIDGALDTASTFGVPMLPSGGFLSLGNNHGGAPEYMAGSLDEVRIWSYARSETEIQAAYRSSVPTDSAGLHAYYDFDEGLEFDDPGGQTIRDVSGNGRDGFMGTTLGIDAGDPAKGVSTAPLDTLFTRLPSFVSLSSGGTAQLALKGPAGFEQHLFVVLGSLSGTTPALPVGSLSLPLALDAYFNLTLTNPGASPLSGSIGVLDGAGAAAATFTLPAASPAVLAGTTVQHAFVLIDPVTAALSTASNPAGILLTP